ncbi:MAG: type II toxin-antitoxin system HicB family antitoxin [Spirochaetales bacterium]|nr:type II toxin-antitoxin system HicB family antitoxin [Spirochaetales bacterium]
MNRYKFSVVIEKDKDGYSGFCPELQGCFAQGNTYEEIIENMKDAIKLNIEDRLDDSESVPQSDYISLASVELAV